MTISRLFLDTTDEIAADADVIARSEAARPARVGATGGSEIEVASAFPRLAMTF